MFNTTKSYDLLSLYMLIDKLLATLIHCMFIWTFLVLYIYEFYEMITDQPCMLILPCTTIKQDRVYILKRDLS